MGDARSTLSAADVKRWSDELLALPAKAAIVLQCAAQCQQLAAEFKNSDDFLFLGRAIHYPIAMDGALKLKEVSYVHAEGYPAGESKHGPVALVDEHMPLVMLTTGDQNDAGSVLRYKKTVSGLRALKQQRARVIALATEGDEEVPAIADHTVLVPAVPELLAPVLEMVPLQLFAYYMAVARGRDVDRPRNLVKSVRE